MSKNYNGKIVDVVAGRIFDGTVSVEGKKIVEITEDSSCHYSRYIIPGFIDSHIHIESSMLIPSTFAKLTVKNGTVGVVADPHEIANVLGVSGVDYMINDGKRVPFKFYFCVPSCVPATPFETSGAVIDSTLVEKMIARNDLYALGEMMNYPGVIYDDQEVIRKIKKALAAGKVVDGHAPGLSGEALLKYAATGISTDHECVDIKEAEEKIAAGMDIQIREGSAARNFDALIDLMKSHSDKLMFCSDDKHPDSLLAGHINLLAQKAVARGYDAIKVLRACSLNPIRHYKLDVGLLQKGDFADFVVVDNLHDFNIQSTYINGQCVYDTDDGYCEEYQHLQFTATIEMPNRFEAGKLSYDSLKVEAEEGIMHVICTNDCTIGTRNVTAAPKIADGLVVPDVKRDLLKMVVYNRYTHSAPHTAFVHGFNLKQGAIASTIAHDSHNIIAVGTDDKSLVDAINQLIQCKGGIIAGYGDDWELLPLPIAGLMSPECGEVVAAEYGRLNDAVTRLGCLYKAPFMTLSFMALLVIPELKLSDKGLFDSKNMKFTSLFGN